MSAVATVRTRYWHPLPDGRIQCDVCPRACKLREVQRGLCFVRAREGDEVVLTTYGRSSCPRCGDRVIERDWYRLGEYRLTDDGCCARCGERLAGVFAGRPGAWGRRRLAVRLAGTP